MEAFITTIKTLVLRFSIQLIVIVLCVLATSNQAVLSQDATSKAPAGTTKEPISGNLPQSTQGLPARRFQFNLSSTQPCISAGHHHNFHFADINESGEMKTVVPTDLLTPAEYVALHQVLSTGTQTVQLGPGGKAIGGRFKVDPQLEAAIKELAMSNSPALGEPTTAQLDKSAVGTPTSRKVVAGSNLADEEWIRLDGADTVVSGAAVKIGNNRKVKSKPAPSR